MYDSTHSTYEMLNLHQDRGCVSRAVETASLPISFSTYHFRGRRRRPTSSPASSRDISRIVISRYFLRSLSDRYPRSKSVSKVYPKRARSREPGDSEGAGPKRVSVGGFAVELGFISSLDE